MTDTLEMNRRQFAVTTAAVGGGMVLGLNLTGGVANAANAVMPEPWMSPPGNVGAEINAWIVIAPDDTITIRVAQNEIGTGTFTSMPMLVCEELECDWSKVQAELASANRTIRENGVYQRMGVGGSGSVTGSREYLMKAGASARERLKLAAAAQWNVPVTEIDAKASKLTHRPTGRTLRYGEVAARAATVRLEKEPEIKKVGEFTFIGKVDNVKRFDTPVKVNGSAVFGIDAKVPGMLHAAVKTSPVFGAKIKSFDAASAKARPGVIDVLELGKDPKHSAANWANQSRSGVAVVAQHYWQARTALDAMQMEWDEGAAGRTSTDEFFKTAIATLDKPGAIAKKNGDALSAMKDARRTIDSLYTTPFVDHAVMEPINATVLVGPGKVEVWASTQNPQATLEITAEELGVPKESVHVYSAFVGGGFGRRGGSGGAEARQAAFLSKTLGGKPVKVIWSREETTRQGAYRPFEAARFKGGLDANGNINAMHVIYAGQSTTIQRGGALGNGIDANNKVDANQIRGITDVEYTFPHMQLDWHAVQTHVPTGAWRGPGVNQNAFMYESFIDECCAAGGKDPVEMRRVLLANAKDPGWLKVLNEVATKANWGKPLPKGSGQGFAMTLDHGTIIACVAEVTVSKGGELRVVSADMAFDMGNIVNKADIIGQFEGGTAYGLSAMLHEEITVRNGRVVEGNFDDYRLMRIDEMPVVRAHFGGMTGGAKWTGIGEPTTVIIPPAVGNAIFRATGKRVRSMPLKNEDLTWS